MHKQELFKEDGITIRFADIADIGEIAALATELAVGEGQMPHTTEATLARDVFCNAPKCQMLVAQKGIESIGFVMFYDGYDRASASGGYHLGDVIVAPLHREKGIGTLLMKALAQHALQQNRDWVSWTVSKGNVSAKKFYLEAIKATQVDVDFMAMGKTALRVLTEV